MPELHDREAYWPGLNVMLPIPRRRSAAARPPAVALGEFSARASQSITALSHTADAAIGCDFAGHVEFTRRPEEELGPQMVYKMPIPTRKEWQTLRDKNKVPKGAAKVSIGDDIDAVHKTFSLATISSHQKATDKLLKDLDVYIATVKKKHPDFEAIVTKELKKKVDAHMRIVSDEIKAKTEYYPRYSAVVTAYKALDSGKGRPKDVAKAMERLLGCLATFALVDPNNWDKKRQGLNRVMSEFERADALTDGHRQVFTKLMEDLKP
jgi:hypothetical protein